MLLFMVVVHFLLASPPIATQNNLVQLRSEASAEARALPIRSNLQLQNRATTAQEKRAAAAAASLRYQKRQKAKDPEAYRQHARATSKRSEEKQKRKDPKRFREKARAREQRYRKKQRELHPEKFSAGGVYGSNEASRRREKERYWRDPLRRQRAKDSAWLRSLINADDPDFQERTKNSQRRWRAKPETKAKLAEAGRRYRAKRAKRLKEELASAPQRSRVRNSRATVQPLQEGGRRVLEKGERRPETGEQREQ